MTAPVTRPDGGDHGVLGASGRVRATAPSRPGGYWPLSCYSEDGRRIGQTTGGRTRETAARLVAEEERRLSAAGLPGSLATPGQELFDYFLRETRAKFPHSGRRQQAWSASYTRQATGLIDSYLRPVLGQVRLAAWTPAEAYRALDRCPTNYVVEKTRRVLSSVLTVGLENPPELPDAMCPAANGFQISQRPLTAFLGWNRWRVTANLCEVSALGTHSEVPGWTSAL